MPSAMTFILSPWTLTWLSLAHLMLTDSKGLQLFVHRFSAALLTECKYAPVCIRVCLCIHTWPQQRYINVYCVYVDTHVYTQVP